MLRIKTYIYLFLYAGEKLPRSFHASVTDNCTTTAVTGSSLSWPGPFSAGHLSIRDYKHHFERVWSRLDQLCS